MKKRVEGIYEYVEDALQAVEILREKGYPRDSITLVANEETRASLGTNLNANVTTEDDNMIRAEDNDRSIWDSIKDAFTTDDSYDDSKYDDSAYDHENDPLYPYRDSIRKGQIAVVVTGEPTDTGMIDQRTDTDTDVAKDETLPGALTDTDTPRDLDHDETIELREEHLKVDKEKEVTGEVHISKKVVEDTETIDVPVTREEVSIERKPVSEKSTDTDIDVADEEEIVLPIEEEKVHPKKETDVVEEVIVKKETKEDTETVGDTVHHEELEVEEDGDLLNRDDENRKSPKDDTLNREISNNRFDEDDLENRR